MSGIFGMVYLDGREVPRVVVDRLCDRASAWGPDGVSRWHSASAVLGRALLASVPEDAFDAMPAIDDQRQVAFVAAARLDNRDELCETLDVPPRDRGTTSDAWLAWLAWRRWDVACPGRLRGDWALAAWDRGRRALFLARDHIGNTSLFYVHRPPLVAFASDVDVLFTVPGIPRRLDEEQLGRYLLIQPGDLDRTCFDGVRSIVPAHQLSIDPGGARSVRYWRIEDAPEVRLASDADYADAFLAEYRRAVRTRLRSTRCVASTLSSGLDSGSVTALAAEALGERGQRVLALTSVPVHDGDAAVGEARADEGPLARDIAARWNLEHVLVDAAAVSPVAAVERSLELYAQPVHGAANLYWLLEFLALAKARGASVLLTGQLGNGSVSWNGGCNRVFYFFADGSWRRGFAALGAWRTAHGASLVQALRAHVLAPLLGPAMEYRYRLKHPARAGWTDISAIEPAFRARLARAGKLEPGGDVSPGFRPRPTEERAALFSLNGAAAGPVMQAFGAAHRLSIRDPTADLGLIEFCCGLPDDQYVHGGTDRMLIRRAMAGLLPPSVQWNTRRGLQASDLTARLLDHRGDMHAALDRLSASTAVREYLDVAALRDTWSNVPRNTRSSSHQARMKLLRGIMAGFFVMRVSSDRQGDRPAGDDR